MKQGRIASPFNIVMEDGTPLTDVPKNPLIDKWKADGCTKDSYGRDCSSVLGYYEDGRPIMNYNCVLCHSSNCYLSDDWKIPEEDKETFEKWQSEVTEFYKAHSPEMYHRYLEV